MIQPSHNSQNTNYQDRCYAYNQAFYASSSSSEIEEKTEMFEDSGSEVEVQTTCKTGQEENANCKSNSAPIKGGMQIITISFSLWFFCKKLTVIKII